MKEKILNLFVFWGVFGLYLRHVAPSITSGDSGEFMTTAATLSLAHPPSYPLYSILARGFLNVIPWGSVLLQMNMFSAFCSALSVLVLIQIARDHGLNRGGSIFLALILALSSSLWLNSLVTEVFALNTLWFLILILSMQRAFWISQKFEYGVLSSFLLGLGLGNHHVLVMFGFPLLVFLFRLGLSIKKWTIILMAGMVGFSIYLVLPIRSSKNPPLNWGQPTTIQKLYRTISRKDYGSLKLTIEKSPERNLNNSLHQMKRFGKQLSQELPFVFLVGGLGGLLWGCRKNIGFNGSILFLFILSGPFFYGLANLPFDAQSDGIMGRFFIIPTLLLGLGWIEFLKKFNRITSLALVGLIVFVFQSGVAEARSHRSMFLVHDYGNAILRTLPPTSVLFMDGGDDTFYSLAALHYAVGKRPDVELHDRGGLIYKSVYGEDFRRIPKDKKESRREQVEKSYLGKKDLFYATMEKNILPGVPLFQKGFLYEAQRDHPDRISWPLITLRSLYPLGTSDYRTRALGPYFPYQQGIQFLNENKLDNALNYFRRAVAMGYDIAWLKSNLGYLYSRLGYQYIIDAQFEKAEDIYVNWIRFDDTQVQAYTNLGIVYEKLGAIDKAEDQYQLAQQKFPRDVDPVFNLGVLYWHQQKWSQVVEQFSEVLRRDPTHQKARIFLEQAKTKI